MAVSKRIRRDGSDDESKSLPVPEKSFNNFTAAQILEDAKKESFGSAEPSLKFHNKYKREFIKSGSTRDGTILHELSRRPEDCTSDKVGPFLQWLIGTYPKLLRVEAELYKKWTPLHMALWCKNNTFVKTVLDKWDQKTLGKVLKTTKAGSQNCLHLAIEGQSRFTEDLIRKCSDYKEVFSHNDEDLNTPLHYAVMILPHSHSDESGTNGKTDNAHFSQFRTVELLIEMSSNTLLQPNKNGNTPYQARIAVLRERFDRELDNAAETKGGVSENEEVDEYASDGDSSTRGERYQGTNNEGTIKDEDEGSRGREEQEEDEDEEDEEEEEEIGSGDDLMFRRRAIEDPISSIIRSYCIRKFERAEVMKALYHSRQERQIDFNLSGRSNVVISRAYLNRLARHLKFESILKYVALPRLSVELPVTEEKEKTDEENEDVETEDIEKSSYSKQRGLTSMVEIFQWLRDNNVKEILMVIVIDNGNPSHSDEAIERALHGFGIEVWDWKKIDLNSDVISNCTNSVREISLYSSGNNSVLMGWYSTEGIRNVEKFPKLEKVQLYIQKGLENKERLQSYIKTFETKLKSYANESGKLLEVHTTHDNDDTSYAADFRVSGNDLQRRNLWIDSTRDFATFIHNIPNTEIAPVKVAVIDNGVDAALEILDGKIASGMSFCPYPNSSYLMNPYYVTAESLGHGSVVSALICQMCPKARLYVGRLDERSSSGSNREITAESAANAIEWAISRNVDVISMSWTIETNNDQAAGMKKLFQAIDKAHKKNIVMVCSASDQGSASKVTCYPGKWNKCIRIGASTGTGEKCAWVHGEDVDFIFPGENVPFDRSNEMPPTYHSGSSVATAIAAGTASLLLYCNKLIASANGGARYSNDLKSLSAMMNAFDTMSIASNNNCPRVGYFFDKRFGNLKWKLDRNKSLDVLISVMKKIKEKKEFH